VPYFNPKSVVPTQLSLILIPPPWESCKTNTVRSWNIIRHKIILIFYIYIYYSGDFYIWSLLFFSKGSYSDFNNDSLFTTSLWWLLQIPSKDLGNVKGPWEGHAYARVLCFGSYIVLCGHSLDFCPRNRGTSHLWFI
jgi:hypothetical protein